MKRDGDKREPAVVWSRAQGWLSRVKEEYSAGQERPLGGYLGLITIYTGGTAAAALLAKALKRPMPARVSTADLLLVGLATHKLSRMIAKDPVLSPFRAPFTKFAGQSGEAELSEEVRGHGLQHAAGELITCPFCLAQWVSTGLVAGLVLAPKPTRLLASTITAKAISDTAQLLYDATQKATQSLDS
jgi:hypothetical protein